MAQDLEEILEPKNTAKYYGFSRAFLNEVFSLGRKRNRARRDPEYDSRFYALKRTYHGLFNAHVPHEMYQFLNPLEIAALYCGAGIAKESGLPSVIYESFPETVSRLVHLAFEKYPQVFGAASKKHAEPYDTGKGEMRKRMEQFGIVHPDLAGSFKDSFYNYLRMPYSRHSPTRNFYHDPNIDGHSISVYINCIAGIFKKEFEKNTINKLDK